MSQSDWKTPSVKFLGVDQWKAIDIWTYYSPTHNKSFTVPFGLISDGVSSPRVLWSVVPATGTLFPAGFVHDGMYAIKRWDDGSPLYREEADACLCDMAHALGLDDIACEAVHAAVRVGGAAHW